MGDRMAGKGWAWWDPRQGRGRPLRGLPAACKNHTSSASMWGRGQGRDGPPGAPLSADGYLRLPQCLAAVSSPHPDAREPVHILFLPELREFSQKPHLQRLTWKNITVFLKTQFSPRGSPHSSRPGRSATPPWKDEIMKSGGWWGLRKAAFLASPRPSQLLILSPPKP